MRTYDITVKIVIKKSYLVEADNTDEATTKALEQAIKEYPGEDVWLDNGRA